MLNRINVFSWINIGSKLISPIFVLPILMMKYSGKDIEVWFLLLNFVSLTVFFDFGFISLQNRLYAYTLHSQKFNYRQLLNGNFNTIFVVISVFWTGMLYVSNLFISFHVNLLLSASIIAYFLMLIIQNVLFSYGKIVESKNIETVFNLLRTVFFYFQLRLNQNMVDLVDYYNYINIIGLVAFILCLKYYLPDYRFNFTFSKSFIKKYISQVSSAWIATFLSNGMFYISSIYLAERYLKYDWSAYLFTFRVLDLVIVIGFVPFYSRVPLFINHYKLGKILQLRQELKRNIVLSCIMYLFLLVFLYFAGSFALNYIKAHSTLLDPVKFIILSSCFFFYKLGASFLQISSFGNKVKWHIAHIIHVSVLIIIYLSIHIQDRAMEFLIPFLISTALVYFPLCVMYAYKLSNSIFKNNSALQLT